MPIKTGLAKLDNLLKGGFPNKSSILLMGPPKSGKTLFTMQYMLNGLNSGEYGIHIITNDFPEDFVEKLGKFEKIEPILEKGLLRFVDCYSVYAGIPKESTVFIIRVNGSTALNEISIALTKILEKLPKTSKKRIVLDSLSTLLLYNNPLVIEKFVQVVNGKAKAYGSNIIFVAEEGMHDQKDVTTLTALIDSLIHFKQENKKSYMEIMGMGIKDNTLSYVIEDGRIKVN